MVTARYPNAVWRPLPRHFTVGGMVQPSRGLIPHVQQGNGSLHGWFSNPASQVSAHLWLSKSGVFEQYVSLADRAWAQGAGNPHWVSVECEGFDREDYSEAQVQRLAELFAWGMREFGWPAQVTDSPAGYGLGAHRMGGAAWGGHSCPGDIRAGRRQDILRAALSRPTTPPPGEETDMPLTDAEIKAISKQVRADLTTEVRYATSGNRRIVDMAHGSGGEALGIGVLGVQELREDVATIKAQLAALTGEVPPVEQPLTVERMLTAIGQATDTSALAAFIEHSSVRLRTLLAGAGR